jgi:capsular exopolysaccharide synthesis family protein
MAPIFGNKTPVTIEPPAPAMPVSGVPGGPGGYGESEVHLLDRLSVLYRYRHIVAAVVIVVMIGGAVQTYTTTKEYRAFAMLQIDPDRPTMQGIGQSMFSDADEEYAMATELTNLKSHTLALRVARKLNLAANPEFNGQEGQPTGLGDALLNLRSRLTQPIMAIFRKPVATPAKQPAAQVKPDEAVAGGVTDETPEEAARVNQLMGKLTVNPQTGSRQVRLDVVSIHPEFAAAAANAFANEYVAQNLLKKTVNLQAKRDQYMKQVEKTKIEVETMRRQYNELAAKTPQGAYIDPSVLAASTNDARRQWTTATDNTEKMKAELDRLSKVDLKDDTKALEAAKTVPGLSTDSVVVGYLNTIEDIKKNKRKLMAENEFGVGHPKIVGLDTDINSTVAQLKTRLRTLVDTARLNYDVAVKSEDRYKTAYEITNETGSKQSNEGINLVSLSNSINTRQSLLEDMQKMADQANVEASSTHNNAQVADPAQIPSRPFRPDPARNMLMALMAGFVLALGLAFGLDYLDDTVKTPEDITRKLHVPFLGLVPSVRGEKQPVLSGPVPHDFGESYRALRTSLVFTSGGESTRVITVTSAQPLEGKTTTACNLAMVLAFGGSRVLLMDADMRRPGVHKALKINNTVGLSHLLVGQARVREAIQRTSDPNFCVMTAGRTPPNPSELLSSERMRQLVANLKQGPFDWVVIDTPPVLAVTDAVILTPLVDGVTFVVGAEMTRRRLAERAVHMIMASRPKVVGAVLNRVNFDRNKYYYSRYYGYQYKSYYGTHTGGASAPPKA